ncbi:glycosyl hydrolase family 28-related protein [Paenibacillus glycinis]|uniref:Rhamnogalacturonase A/B/Epimerase-like pectate lyase domain-containing protein n=1 Tax=Paenibacillus glycinis TaxID=2697035 RepID=A0ABW9XLZ2_9BACL|nr:glycosyl hydrolase family 28-related protein [Paenibacillus glycinis]NBD23615.1 hypothetical protein [Paenibacillus glycinis]
MDRRGKMEKPISRRRALYILSGVAVGLAAGIRWPFRKSETTIIRQEIDLSDPYTDVKAFGAKGDGVTDDYRAIMKAVKSATEGNRILYFPRGKYVCSGTIELPVTERPNTAGTAGSGFKIVGAGMYDSGILYTGSGYAIQSNHELAESVSFKDFYVNHARGGGIRLPQGAHQAFERFFSSACGKGRYGVLIEGAKSNGHKKGSGAYMISLTNCRFWSERGYSGTGLRLEDVQLCARIESCFFSTLTVDRSHLELVRTYGVQIDNCAFERLEDPESKAPLITIDQSHAVSILGCHAEATFESFVGIKGHSSNVRIDGCRVDHYAITPFNYQRGFIVSVDSRSTGSRKIIVGDLNYCLQSNHQDAVHGSMIDDPVGCVTVMGYEDATPFQQDWERRTVSVMGNAGHNVISNPALYSNDRDGLPNNVQVTGESIRFEQLQPSGCRLSSVRDTGSSRVWMTTVESMNKYPDYTLFIVGSNRSGKAMPMAIEAGNRKFEPSMLWPSGRERFTQSIHMRAVEGKKISFTINGPFELDLFGVYLVPNITTQAPYGSELLAGSKLHVGREIRFGDRVPEQPGEIGDIVFNGSPAEGGRIGWAYTANGWKSFGSID